MVHWYHVYMLALKGATFRLLRIYLFQLFLSINSDNFSEIHQINLAINVFGNFYEELLCYILFKPAVFFEVLKAYLILIYLLTAVGLSPGGSTHLHTNNM